jgi:SPP1 gp7 family putative phage head morphogenesis protein
VSPATRKPPGDRGRSLLRRDPSRTLTLRRAFAAQLGRQFARLKGRVVALVLREDALALATNARWQFATSPEKLAQFRSWLDAQFASTVAGQSEEALWARYVEQGYKKGAGRAFDDVRRRERALAAGDRAKVRTYDGTREAFLRDGFARPVAAEKVQLLAGRAFDELGGVTDQMGVRMGRVLADGLVRGQSPGEVARALAAEVDVGRDRAIVISRTELLRSHNEGALTALENLGVEEVGVAVEWETAEGACPKCSAMEGVVLRIDEARGLIPLHPQCRCCWVPSNVGEDTDGQVRGKGAIDDALAEAGVDDLGVSADRPESVLNAAADHGPALEAFSRWLAANAFCPTGEGGGVDPSCPAHPGGGPAGGRAKFVGARVDGTVHAHAEAVKHEVARLVGGVPEELTADAGQKDKKPYDVKVPGVRGSPDQDVEVKSMTVGGKQSISVHEDALLRKVEHAERTGNGFHTVVVDDRETYNNGANKANYSGNRLYYRRGSGRFALSTMHPVKDEAELRKLIALPDHKLPEKARGGLPPPPPVAKLREGAAKASEGRKARDAARKGRNRDVLRGQARARAEKARAAKAAGG